MKTLMLASMSALALLAAPALAQAPGAPDLSIDPAVDLNHLGVEAIMSRLALTEESVDIVEPAVVEIVEKHTDLLESARAGTANKATLQRQLAQDREHTDERLRGVLNAAQFEELGKIQDELGAQVLAQAISL